MHEKDEHVMDYFQSEVRLFRDLSLSFNEVHDYVIQGVFAGKIAMFILGITYDENKRMNILRNMQDGIDHMAQSKSKEVTKGKDGFK